MSELMRATDWSATPLGPCAGWSSSLRIAISAMLDAPLPTFLLWGPELIQFYNDAFVPILGLRHPLAMGQRTQHCWPEVWHFNGPIYHRVLFEGARVHLEDQEYVIEPSGFAESRYFTFTYAPARDESGLVCGIQVMTIETTRRVLAERRNTALLAVKAFQLELADCLRALTMPDQILAAACQLLGRHVGAAQVVFADVDDARDSFIVAYDWARDDRLALTLTPLLCFSVSVMTALRSGDAVVIDDVAQDDRTAANAATYARADVRAHLAMPLLSAGRLISVLSVYRSAVCTWSDVDIKLAKSTVARACAAMGVAVTQAQLQHSRSMLRKLTANQENVREDERKRIARDIHDDLGQNLMALRLDVSMMLAQPGSAQPSPAQPGSAATNTARVDAVLNQIDRTIKSVRSIMNDLRPAVLNLGLHAALEWQATQFQHRNGIVCQLHIDHDEFQMDDQRSTALFRIVQESLSNVLRHARASQVEIALHRSGDQIQVTISDDGIGLAAGCRKKADAFGLVGMEERIHGLGGTVAIANNASLGMAIRVSVPISVPISATIDTRLALPAVP